MHKNIFVLLTCLLFYVSAFSCDLCSIYIALDPNGTNNSFGTRYRYRLFEKDYFRESFYLINNPIRKVKGTENNKHGSSTEQRVKTTEKFTFSEVYNSYDIFANFYLNPRLQLNLSTYFADNYILNNDSIVTNVAGIGDASVVMKYRVYNSKKCNDSIQNRFLHRFTVGGGIDLPTGSFNKSTITGVQTRIEPNTILGSVIEELDPHIQAGTGSISYLFLMEYMIKVNNFGINTNASYKLTTTNKNGFRFANRFNANGTLFVLLNLSKKLKVMPFMGSTFETSKRDLQDNIIVLGSGGKVLFMNTGLNFFINKLSVEFSYYRPIYEDLLDDQPFNNNRIIAQLAYYF